MRRFGVHPILSNPLKYSSPKNTLPWWRVFNLAKNTLVCREFVVIFRDYPLKTRPSKQPTGEIPGYGIIPSNTLEVNKASGRTRAWRGYDGVPRPNLAGRGSCGSRYQCTILHGSSFARWAW
jgi:hypothetical protein